MSERKRITFTAIAVALVGIVTGLLLGGGLLPSQAAYQIYDERVTTETTETAVVHSHDSIPQHTHTITTEITTTDTTPHGYFHGLAPAAASTPTAATLNPAQGADEIWIYDMAYTPGTTTVPVGTTVTWTQVSGEGHPIAIDGLFDTFLRIGDSSSYTFTEPGTYQFYCSEHGETGTVTVE